ncbi:hypothetical protein LIER_36394 [Lithospermum erythrorhizon]|uniref:Ribosomal protein L16 n=1 Tax=Lithospermum erythrorhizon TaxID=34254 RepID=A0AAV3P9A3_LITER
MGEKRFKFEGSYIYWFNHLGVNRETMTRKSRKGIGPFRSSHGTIKFFIDGITMSLSRPREFTASTREIINCKVREKFRRWREPKMLLVGVGNLSDEKRT